MVDTANGVYQRYEKFGFTCQTIWDSYSRRYKHHIINEKVNDLIASGKYREVDVLKTRGYPHRVIQKL